MNISPFLALVVVSFQAGSHSQDNNWVSNLSRWAQTNTKTYRWGSSRELSLYLAKENRKLRDSIPEKVTSGSDPRETSIVRGTESDNFKQDWFAYKSEGTDCPAAARQKLEGILKARKDDATAAQFLAELCNRIGRYDEALAISAPFIAESAPYVRVGAPPKMLINAALAAAMLGYENSGMHSFTQSVVSRYLKDIPGADENEFLSGLDGKEKLSALEACACSYADWGDFNTEIMYVRLAKSQGAIDPAMEYEIGTTYRAQGRLKDAEQSFANAAQSGLGQFAIVAKVDEDAVSTQLTSRGHASR